jgi:hypothetical protein
MCFSSRVAPSTRNTFALCLMFLVRSVVRVTKILLKKIKNSAGRCSDRAIASSCYSPVLHTGGLGPLLRQCVWDLR